METQPHLGPEQSPPCPPRLGGPEACAGTCLGVQPGLTQDQRGQRCLQLDPRPSVPSTSPGLRSTRVPSHLCPAAGTSSKCLTGICPTPLGCAGTPFAPSPRPSPGRVPHGERLFPRGLAVPAHGPHHVPFLQTFWTLSSTSEPVSVTLNLTRVAAPSTAFQSRTVRPAPRDPAQGLSRGRPHLCPEDPSGCEVGPVGRRRRRRRPGRLPPPSPHRPGGAFASSCFSKA